jgi:hypothetical protein
LALTLAAGNAGNLNSGTLAAARMPALTGDCTTSAGAVATTCTKINGVDQTTAWTTYTPTITASSGTITTVGAVSGRYRQIGKTIIAQISATITTAGTAAGQLQATLPFTAAAFDYIGSSRDYVVSGTSGAAWIASGGTFVSAALASASAATPQRPYCPSRQFRHRPSNGNTPAKSQPAPTEHRDSAGKLLSRLGP